jgi:hypothetical protein
MAGELTIRLQRGDIVVELQGDAETVRATFAALKEDGLGALAPFLGLGATVTSKNGTPTIAPSPISSLTKPSASFQFVLDALRLPTKQQNFASDINGDGRPDNVFANIIIALQSQGFNLQGSIDTELQAAPPIVLLTLATEFATPASDQRAAVTLFAGLPVKPAQHVYMIDTRVSPVTVEGHIAAGRFVSEDPRTGGVLVKRGIPIPFGPGIVAELPIQGLQLAFDVAVNGVTIPTGQITGSLRQADVQNILLPAFAALMNNVLKNNPQSPLGQLFDTGGTMNPDGTTAQAGDGVIGVSELLTTPLISTLLAPDVQIWDATGENYAPNPLGGRTDSMSFGIGFSAVAASY